MHDRANDASVRARSGIPRCVGCPLMNRAALKSSHANNSLPREGNQRLMFCSFDCPLRKSLAPSPSRG